jgi:hypothetical protein
VSEQPLEADDVVYEVSLEADAEIAAPFDTWLRDKVPNDPCSEENIEVEIGPPGERYGPRLRQACSRIVADTPGFGRTRYENIPKMMFLFLPLIAVVLYVLHLGSGRYFAERAGIATLAKYAMLGIACVFAMAFTAAGLLAYTALTMQARREPAISARPRDSRWRNPS